jgi:SpoVK/Ycf46/Vps4 family AAA+-type ATPase
MQQCNFLKMLLELESEQNIEMLCNKLDINERQVLLLSKLINKYQGDAIYLQDFSKLFEIGIVEFLSKYLSDLRLLEEKGFIFIEEADSFRARELSFIIKLDAIEGLSKGEEVQSNFSKKETVNEFLEEINSISRFISEHRYYEKSYEKSLNNFSLLLKRNDHFPIVRKIEGYNMAIEMKFVMFYFFTSLFFFDKDEIPIRDFEDILKNNNYARFRLRLRCESTELQEYELIEFGNSEGFSSTDTIKLTKKAKKEFLEEIEFKTSAKAIKNIMLPSKIEEKKLFYPQKTERQINELGGLLEAEKFEKVRRNLKEKGMRTGFACLFMGGPGTGKTETALQLAKRTGRGIMQVDIAESKSKWFGESEKQIKEIFSKYRTAVEKLDVAPILLFNEADAIIGKRQVLDEVKRGVGQTENAMQNIILQEIENLDGILIATTNLMKNMDSAFERRFLYKIEFEKPTPEAMAYIWQTMLPNLSRQEAEKLSDKFTFSGGQIENIARKNMVRNAIYGEDLNFEELLETAKDEFWDYKEERRMGF